MCVSSKPEKSVYVFAKVKPQFRYVAQLSEDYDDLEDYAPVIGLKSLNQDDADTFREDLSDAFAVSLSDVIEILPTPIANFLSSTRIVLVFPRKISVREK